MGHHRAGANWHKKEQTGLPRRSKARTECRERDTLHDSTCEQPRKSGLTCSDREQLRALHQLVLRHRDGRREDRDRVRATVTFSILTVVPIPWLCRLVQSPHTVLKMGLLYCKKIIPRSGIFTNGNATEGYGEWRQPRHRAARREEAGGARGLQVFLRYILCPCEEGSTGPNQVH